VARAVIGLLPWGALMDGTAKRATTPATALTQRKGGGAMAAYAIGHLEMRDPSWVQEYGPKTAALVAKHGGRYLVRGRPIERLEGAGPLPSLLVVLEFPSLEQAQAWYNDPEYAPLITLRQTGADLDFLLVEGL
jgi:uncharacterized protein (DUF1330 family)